MCRCWTNWESAALEAVYTVALGMLGPAKTSSRHTTSSARKSSHHASPECRESAVARDGYEFVANTPAQFTADIQTELDLRPRIIRGKRDKAVSALSPHR